MSETTRLANTIRAWWPAILDASIEKVTNARTEGFNRISKRTKGVGCGYHNIDKFKCRILRHVAVTRRQSQQHDSAATPLKFRRAAKGR